MLVLIVRIYHDARSIKHYISCAWYFYKYLYSFLNVLKLLAIDYTFIRCIYIFKCIFNVKGGYLLPCGT